MERRVRFGYALTAKVDDVGFVRRLLDELQATYRIDPDRIYATGISNGGILSANALMIEFFRQHPKKR